MAGTRDVEVRHLLALRAVAEEGTFGRAATRLGFSQAAISQQIGALERTLGEPVFDRPGGPRAVVLTPAGRLMLQHAEAILDRLAVAEVELDQLRSGEAGRLVIGTFQSVSVQLLPAVLTVLRAESPALQIGLFEHDENDELAARLLDDRLDLTFLVGPVDDQHVDAVELCRDPFVAILPASDPQVAGLAPGASISARTLVDRPLIGQVDSTCHRLIDDGLRRHGVEPHYVFRSNDNSAVQAMVRAGMGAAVLPLLAVDTRDPGVRVVPMSPGVPPRSILIATRRGRTLPAAARRFVELAGRTAAHRPGTDD